MESLDRWSTGLLEKAFTVMDDDRIATHWVLEHSNERAFGIADVHNLEYRSLHKTYGREATGGNI